MSMQSNLMSVFNGVASLAIGATRFKSMSQDVPEPKDETPKEPQTPSTENQLDEKRRQAYKSVFEKYEAKQKQAQNLRDFEAMLKNPNATTEDILKIIGGKSSDERTLFTKS